MKTISYKSGNFQKELGSLFTRQVCPKGIEESVRKIVEDVRLNGDKAVSKYLLKFDSADLKPDRFLVPDSEIREAGGKVSPDTKKAINTAIRNVTAFSKKRIPKDWKFSPRPGVVLGEKFSPLNRIGAYIPGGTAPLISTSVHTVAIAKCAGVRQIVAVTPPNKNGEIHPALLYALSKSGATEIYRLGGVYAIAALAYGTKTVQKVDKIVGPGNAYVTTAKKIVYGDVAIDMVAGPSEIMVIADKTCRPDFIAADMLSQAEHGSGLEQAVLVTDSSELIEKVKEQLVAQAKLLKRSAPVAKVLANGVFFILVKNIADSADIANRYAPEHLEIMCLKAEVIASKINAAGAIFIGQWTPEPVGDFVAGPSHVLPTAGTAKYFSGLTVEQFFRRTSILKYDKKSFLKELPQIAKFAEIEGLDAHGRSATIRDR
ncbi:MAG: histidinol dehydrogenase [Victivallales bacterium]|jgi:histidinol dehydrogenase